MDLQTDPACNGFHEIFWEVKVASVILTTSCVKCQLVYKKYGARCHYRNQYRNYIPNTGATMTGSDSYKLTLWVCGTSAEDMYFHRTGTRQQRGDNSVTLGLIKQLNNFHMLIISTNGKSLNSKMRC